MNDTLLFYVASGVLGLAAGLVVWDAIKHRRDK